MDLLAERKTQSRAKSPPGIFQRLIEDVLTGISNVIMSMIWLYTHLRCQRGGASKVDSPGSQTQ